MAGRPRAMAARVSEFEERALLLSGDLFVAVPRKYLNAPDPEDPIRRAWHACIRTTMWASIAWRNWAICCVPEQASNRRGRRQSSCRGRRTKDKGRDLRPR